MHSTLLWTKVLVALHSYMISSAHKPPLGNLSPPPTPKLSLSLFFFSGFVVLVFFFLAPHLRIDNGILSRKMHNAETKDFNTF